MKNTCTRHDPADNVTTKDGNRYRVTCCKCGRFLGYHDDVTEAANRNGKRQKKTGGG